MGLHEILPHYLQGPRDHMLRIFCYCKKGVITIFFDNAGISYNRVMECLETLFHYYVNIARKVIRQVALMTGYCEI